MYSVILHGKLEPSNLCSVFVLSILTLFVFSATSTTSEHVVAVKMFIV